MNSRTDGSAPPPSGPDPAHIARRIAERRNRLDLTEDDLATRAGMAPSYLRHLVQAGPDFDRAGFLRIAAALGLSYPELLEGRSDRPPGHGGAPTHPVLVHLGDEECWDRIGARGVGRIALPARTGPMVVPVNYLADAGTLVYRTDPHGAAAPEPGAAVSFQVDRVDDRLTRGWSVLVTGTADHVHDPAEVERLQQLETAYGTLPWAGGERPLWVRITPEQVTGRRIGAVGPDTGLSAQA
ncbi:helix-turn-helix domain-containing protein [Kitasatospora indigofera]|uniref:helix-turn-helix domain-containing protein n=1 Tax=Kitasatospora indigofera TaxID=67307 RepID=UPI00364320F3